MSYIRLSLEDQNRPVQNKYDKIHQICKEGSMEQRIRWLEVRGKEELGRMFVSSNLDMGRSLFFFNFLFFQKEYFWGLTILTDKYLYLNIVDLTVLGQI